MSSALTLPAWEHVARERVMCLVAELHRNDVLAQALDGRAAKLPAPEGWSTADLRDALFLDVVSRRARHLDLPPLSVPELSARARCITANPTRFVLDAARVVGAVTSPIAIAAIESADERLCRSTLGLLSDVPRGRIDLAAQRRCGADRDARLRPSVIPPPPILPAGSTDVARLVFLADEAEWDYVIVEKTCDRYLPFIAKLPVDHRAARGLTGWTATALDARLARGGRWDRVLDAARIRTGDSERGGVLFDPRRFAEWWRGVLN